MEQNYHQSNLGFIYFFNFWTRYLNNLAHKGGLVDQTLVFLNKTKSFKNLIIIQYPELFVLQFRSKKLRKSGNENSG